ncbi:MAG: hypothetical protein M4579_006358 [Chaenotheca gracillima]|nr:MAG: hypothetical protein M4579_006358 [Chaenotheca gracillima]
MSTSNPPKVLLFDVFGTVLDWQTTIPAGLAAATNEKLNSTPGQTSIPSSVRDLASSSFTTAAQWAPFVNEWDDAYTNFSHSFDPTKDEWITVTTNNLRTLKKLLSKYKLEGLFTDDEAAELNTLWATLDPFPDSAPGIAALNRKFPTSTLSNGDVATLVRQAEHAKLPWTHITSSEHFGAYKPNPKVYRGAAEKLGVKTEECALVAAHLGDLNGARACGYQTIYVEREGEERWSEEQIKKAKEEGWVDMWVSQKDNGFFTVAERFGIKGGSVDPDQS